MILLFLCTEDKAKLFQSVRLNLYSVFTLAFKEQRFTFLPEKNDTMCEDTVAAYLELIKKLLARSSHGFSTAASINVPKKPGVYVIYDRKTDALIYVGRTGDLRRRLLGDHKPGNIEGSQFRKALMQHFSLRSESEVSKYILANCSFQFIPIEDFEKTVRLEHFTTAIIGPILNTKLKQ